MNNLYIYILLLCTHDKHCPCALVRCQMCIGHMSSVNWSDVRCALVRCQMCIGQMFIGQVSDVHWSNVRCALVRCVMFIDQISDVHWLDVRYRADCSPTLSSAGSTKITSLTHPSASATTFGLSEHVGSQVGHVGTRRQPRRPRRNTLAVLTDIAGIAGNWQV